jgi:tetratricopeptide (TPR) repeat protein
VPGKEGDKLFIVLSRQIVPESLKPIKFNDMKRDRHILQKYLDNELSEKELSRFEQELSASPELLLDLDLYKEVDEAIADAEVIDFRAQLSDLREETRRTETGRKVFRFTRPWHYAASAAVALLVAIGLATVLGKPLSNSDLFAKYMKPYELVLTNRSMEDDVIKVTMNNAEVAYMKGDFEEAVFWYNEVLKWNSEKVEAEFGVGVSSMRMSKYVDASESFNKVIEHNDNLFVQTAEYYLAGCLLAMDETERARRQLAMIASSANHFYKSDAEKILKRMKR